jgi:hypothetical protein
MAEKIVCIMCNKKLDLLKTEMTGEMDLCTLNAGKKPR